MGNFYSNISLAIDDQAAVVTYLNEQNVRTLVYSTKNFVCVFPETDELLFKLSETLSEKFGCSAFAVMNHDDSLLLYQLFDSGKLIDEYSSCPGHFSGVDEPPTGGIASELSSVYEVADRTSLLEEILRKEYTFELNRHDALVAALNLPYCTVGGGYKYLKEGEVPEEIDLDQSIETNASGLPVSPHFANTWDSFFKLNQSDAATSSVASKVEDILNNPDFVAEAFKKAKLGADAYVKEMLEVEILGSAGDGAVVVTSKGNLQISSIKIKPEVLNPDNVELLQNLVVVALNDVAQKTREKMEDTKKRMLSAQLGQLGL